MRRLTKRFRDRLAEALGLDPAAREGIESATRSGAATRTRKRTETWRRPALCPTIARMLASRFGAASTLLAATLGCGLGGPGVETDAATSLLGTTAGTTTPATTTTTTGTSAPTTSTGTSTGEASSSTTSAVSTDDSGGFVVMPDMPAPPPVTPCDIWNDTCPEGQKCHPYEQGVGWAAGCMEVADPPVPIGGQCNLLWGDLADDCERGAMCFGLGVFAESKRCTPLATGSADAPVCPDPCSHPFVYYGVFGLCTPPCDPLGNDCPEGVVCNSVVHAGKFVCTYEGAAGNNEACVSTDDCVEGSTCVINVLLPNCSSTRCCTPLCQLDAPDPCAAAMPDTTCQTWPPYPELNEACIPPGLGLCTLPL